MVIFENPGIIDIKGAMLFGISAKNSESAIGYFGTGLKYAIAVAMRLGLKVTIHAGTETYVFGTKRIVFRDKSFDTVTMNGNELSFTTELGKNWDLWMAYREFYCNAVDEGGGVFVVSSDEPPMSDYHTYVAVEGAEFSAIHYNKDDFILSSEPVATTDKAELHECSTKNIFYKGIKVFQGLQQFKMTYNFTSQIVLTEDRTIKHSYEIGWRIRSAIAKLTDRRLIKQLLTAGQIYAEDDIDFTGEDNFSTEFMEVARELNANFAPNLNKTIKRLVNKWAKEDWTAELFTPSKQQLRAVGRALDFLKRCGYSDIEEYPIVFKKYLGDGVLAMVHEETIYVTETAINQGVKQLCSTLLEEYVHLTTNLRDETYALQTYLFDKVISLHEEILEEVL